MSMSNNLASTANGTENTVDVGSNNVINESSSDSEYSSVNEVHEALGNFENDEYELPSFAVRMLNLGKELAIFCLIMITYAALTNE